MAEETKTTTTKKRTTTSKPKVEEPKPLSIEEQMAQMMAMMMAQQQQLMELIAKNQQAEKVVEEVVEEVKEVKKEVKSTKKRKRTKQDLRRDYKTVDIYVMNVTQGIVSFRGKNTRYSWDNYGDMEVVAIEDLINMPKKFLNAPYLLIDEYETGEKIKKDIEEVLGIGNVNGYKELLDTIETTKINEMKIEDFAKVVKATRERGCDISLDLAILIQHKIDRKELTNMHLIGELADLLGRKFI